MRPCIQQSTHRTSDNDGSEEASIAILDLMDVAVVHPHDRAAVSGARGSPLGDIPGVCVRAVELHMVINLLSGCSGVFYFRG